MQTQQQQEVAESITSHDVDNASWHVWTLYESGQVSEGDRMRAHYIKRFSKADPHFQADTFTTMCYL